MLNKKIASEIAVGIILLIGIIIAVIFLLQGKEVQAPAPAEPQIIKRQSDEQEKQVPPVKQDEETQFCTQEVKLCDDGKTYVGRTQPSCEFAPCPGEQSNQSPLK